MDRGERMTPAVFLDRDGTMVHDAGYLSRLEDLQWFPWTIDAVRLLNRAGFLVCVTSNQGGIGLGLFPEAFVRDVHDAYGGDARRRRRDASTAGSIVRTIPTRSCRSFVGLRLPQAEARHDSPGGRAIPDRSRAVVRRRRQAHRHRTRAKSAGARGVLVRTGGGAAELVRTGQQTLGADHVAADLMGAATWILEQSGFPRVTA